MGVLNCALGLFVAMCGFVTGNWNISPAEGVVGLFGVAGGAVTFHGGRNLRRLDRYGLVVAGSITAMVPCVSLCLILGLSIGVRALVTANSPEMRAAFRVRKAYIAELGRRLRGCHTHGVPVLEPDRPSNQEQPMATGSCSSCGYVPVARGARTCPQCGKSGPNPSLTDRCVGRGVMAGRGVGLLLGLAVGGVFKGVPAAVVGALVGSVAGLCVGLVLGLVAALVIHLKRGPSSLDAPPPVRRRPLAGLPLSGPGRRAGTVVIRITDADDSPPVCATCGVPATGKQAATYSRNPSWVILFFLAGPLPWLIAFYTTRRRATLAMPICERHARRANLGAKIFLVGLAGAALIGAIGAAVGDRDEQLGSQLIVGAVLLALATPVVACFAVVRIEAEAIDEYSVTLRNVRQKFSEALPGGVNSPTASGARA